MSTASDSFWTPPPRIGRRAYPSVLHFLPTASGGGSVRRILRALIQGEYRFNGQLDDFWKHGDLDCRGTESWPWQPEGELYMVSLSAPLEAWFSRFRHDLERLRLILTIRDPRDSIVSLYHLTTDPSHSAGAAGKPIEASYEEDRRKVQAQSLDEYVRERFVGQLGNLRTMRTLADRLPPESVCCLSYAQLCDDFPRFLQRLVDFLRIDPDPAALAHVLETEDVRHKDRLNPGSLSHCPNAAPMPGRHKRELQAEAIELITRQSKDVLAWLADIDEPRYAGLYLEDRVA